MASTDLESLQRADHDTLIRIEANLSNLATDVKIMGDGLNARVADHELRIQKEESLTIQTNPVLLHADVQKLKQEVHDFKVTANTYRVVGGFIGGLVMFLFTQVAPLLRSFGLIK